MVQSKSCHPLNDNKSIVRKVNRELVKVPVKIVLLYRKYSSIKWKENIVRILDRLFDISACCNCSLPIMPCNDKRVKCSESNFALKHITFLCPENKKCPIEEREYLQVSTFKNWTSRDFSTESYRSRDGKTTATICKISEEDRKPKNMPA